MSSFGFWHAFRLFFFWGVEAWLLLPPLLILILLSLLGVAVCVWRTRSSIMLRWHSAYWLVFVQILFFPIVIAVGAAFQASPHVANPSNLLGPHILDGVMLLSVLLGC